MKQLVFSFSILYLFSAKAQYKLYYGHSHYENFKICPLPYQVGPESDSIIVFLDENMQSVFDKTFQSFERIRPYEIYVAKSNDDLYVIDPIKRKLHQVSKDFIAKHGVKTLSYNLLQFSHFSQKMVVRVNDYWCYSFEDNLYYPNGLGNQIVDRFFNKIIQPKSKSYGAIDISDKEKLRSQKYRRIKLLGEHKGFESVYLVKSKAGFGVVSSYNAVLIEPKYDKIELVSERCFLVHERGKRAVFAPDGKQIMDFVDWEFDYENNKYYNYGLNRPNGFFFKQNNKIGFVSMDGKIIIPCEYEGIELVNIDFFGKYEGKIVCQSVQHDMKSIYEAFRTIIIVARKSNFRFSFFDIDGKHLSFLDDFKGVSFLPNGLVITQLYNDDENFSNETCGLFNRSGEIIIEQQCGWIDHFAGLITISGSINCNNKYTCSIYDESFNLIHSGYKMRHGFAQESVILTNCDTEKVGIANVCSLKNREIDWIIPPVYNSIYQVFTLNYLNDRLYIVGQMDSLSQKNRFGVMNGNGEILVPIIYEDCRIISDKERKYIAAKREYREITNFITTIKIDKRWHFGYNSYSPNLTISFDSIFLVSPNTASFHFKDSISYGICFVTKENNASKLIRWDEIISIGGNWIITYKEKQYLRSSSLAKGTISYDSIVFRPDKRNPNTGKYYCYNHGEKKPFVYNQDLKLIKEPKR